jgi:hypothetical protein
MRYGRECQVGKTGLMNLPKPLEEWCIQDRHFSFVEAMGPPDSIMYNLWSARNMGLSKELLSKRRNRRFQFPGARRRLYLRGTIVWPAFFPV